MTIIKRMLLAIAVISAILIMSGGYAEAKQGGLLIVEPINARMETYIVHRKVFKNYTYELDAEGTDTWQVYDGSRPFVGDCEDFAFTMQYIIGKGSVYPAYLPTGEEVEGETVYPNHAVFVYAGMVWELDGSTLNIQRYEQNDRHIFFRMGDITPELK